MGGRWAGQRQCERGRERNDATHAGPADDRNVLPRWSWVAHVSLVSEQDETDRSPVSPKRNGRKLPSPQMMMALINTPVSDSPIPRVQDSGELQSNDNKDEPVEKEHDRFPKRISLQAKPGADDERGMPPEKDSGGNRRQERPEACRRSAGR